MVRLVVKPRFIPPMNKFVSSVACGRALVMLLSTTGMMHAATLTFSTAAPSGGSASIGNWTGAAFDADNVGGTGVNSNGSPNNGAANDGSTYVAGNRPAQGQTFTTGSNAGGYLLSAITVRMQGYTNNIASGSNIGGYMLSTTSSIFRVRVGEISGTTFIPTSIETAASGGSGNPGSGAQANGPGTYLTFTFNAPIVLKPNTTYGFDLGTTGDYFEVLGIRDGASGGNPYAGGTGYSTGASGVASGSITTQAGDRVFQVDLAPYTAASSTFVHPGLISTEADFERMRTKVALGQSPWLDGYNALTSNWTGQQTNWAPNSQTVVYRGNDGTHAQNYTILANDIAVAYGSALRWKVSGDTAYAEQAIRILNAWSSTLTGLGGDTNAALISINAYQLANVGEIMRTYTGWASTDFAAFKTMMMNVFYPMANDFLLNHFGTSYSHYWANWDLCSMDAIYSIGVLCDNTTLTNQALTYFYGGSGTGNINRAVFFIHPGCLGQVQESGRDQGHSTLDIALIGPLCQMAWNQGVDLYSYESNRVLAGCEYVAKYNLGYDVPFATYGNSEGATATEPSYAARGLERDGWDLIYNHYVNIEGLAAPYTKAFADMVRPTGFFGQDQPGFDTLTATLDPIATGVAPSGLTALVTADQPVLSWWGTAYATSYNVKRSTTSGGPYTTIATGITANTFTDTTTVDGNAYYYVVTATTPSGETAASNEAWGIVGTSIYARLKFDESSGTSASDATGNGWTGTLVNSPAWVTGKFGNAVSLASSSSQYVSMPTGVVSTLSDFSISTWVYLNSVTTWARIFDFGTGTEKYMYLAPKAGSGHVHFAITGSGNYGEEGIDGASALPTGQWVHVAVTISGSTGSLYVNGILVGQNTNMHFTPSALGTTTQNYIGKSQFSDPYLNGIVDDFRIYRGALTAADVQTLANSGVAYLKFNESSGTAAADSTGDGWTGTLVNSPTWATGKLGNAVSLSGSSQYITLPSGVVAGQTGTTLVGWVYMNSVSPWMRIFDFGTGTTKYMFLTPTYGTTGKIRFAITTSGSSGEQRIDGTSALAAGGWHHVAVTLTGSTGTLYVDGVQVGQNTAMTLTPSSLGTTTLNYIGKSQYNDPYLNGLVDDFHIYGVALTAGQIASLYGGLAAPAVTVTAGDSQNSLSWNSVTNATSYAIMRSTTAGGPYTMVASGLTGTSYTDTGLTDGVTYYYVVVAQNSLAQSSNSVEESGYPVPPVPAAPMGLAGIGWNGEVDLAWTAVSTATGYNVKRSTTSGGPYTTIASGVAATGCADTSVVDGSTYYYVVSGTNLGGEGANSSEAAVTYTQPVAYLKFDETSGTTAANASGNGWNGTLVNSPTWVLGRSGNSVDLSGASSQYVTLPSGIVSSLSTCTIAFWANLDSISNWQRFFDFGTGTTKYMFLTPTYSSTGKIRFAITTSGSTAEQRIEGTAAFPATGWHHVAVTLNGSTGTLYVDGVQVGQNAAMTLTPSSLGTTTQNYIGKSQYADPYLNGRMDDFRIYSRALSASEVASLMVNSPAGLLLAPTGVTATAGDSQVALAWSAVANATSYSVYRAIKSGGPYTAVATGLTSASYTDTGLTNGTAYYYVVTAVSAGGQSGNSAEVSATPASSLTDADIVAPEIAISGSGADASCVVTVKTSVQGYSYQLQYCTDLAGSIWNDQGSPASGTGAALSFPPVSVADSKGFYRVRLTHS